DLGYGAKICAKASRPRASSGPDGYSVAFGEVYKIVNNEIIVHISHFVYGFKLIVHPLDNFGGGMLAVML
ncbi:MAG: hypothetical protein Q3982_08090, partial [Phoenicibacter congonensis]|nr:hypothetical protein [Phoenicibacter congonensis]